MGLAPTDHASLRWTHTFEDLSVLAECLGGDTHNDSLACSIGWRDSPGSINIWDLRRRRAIPIVAFDIEAWGVIDYAREKFMSRDPIFDEVVDAVGKTSQAAAKRVMAGMPQSSRVGMPSRAPRIS